MGLRSYAKTPLRHEPEPFEAELDDDEFEEGEFEDLRLGESREIFVADDDLDESDEDEDDAEEGEEELTVTEKQVPAVQQQSLKPTAASDVEGLLKRS